MNVNDIINFTNFVWQFAFSEHTVAPRTLCYDPLNSFYHIYSGLSHIAYNYYTGEDDPDDQIYIIDRPGYYYVNSSMLTYLEISKLPLLECILFVSKETDTNVRKVLEKLKLKAVVIIMHECITLPENWISRPFKILPEYDLTLSPENIKVFTRY